MKRPRPIETNSIHHIYNKSIYRFVIFSCEEEYLRMQQLIKFYRYSGHALQFSNFIRLARTKNLDNQTAIGTDRTNVYPLVEIVAYCLMPTHVHFVLKQSHERGIELFMGRICNAYTRYFNLRHNRRGPLWEHRFGNTPIENDEHLLKAIDYVLTNPVKDNLVEHSSQWKYSYNLSDLRGRGGYLKSSVSVQ